MPQLPDDAQSKLEQFLRNADLEKSARHQSLQPPSPSRKPIKHILIGSPQTVTSTIHHLQIIGYASVGDWSQLIPTGNSGEVMSILIRQILV
jgi:hypothetical protein